MEKISSILKYFLVLVAFAFMVPFFVACGEDNVPVTEVRFLHDSDIVIAQGDSVQLKWAVLPIEASNKIVRFKVDAKYDAYLTVDENGLVTAKNTGAIKTEVIAVVDVVSDYGSGIIGDSIQIKILGEPQALKTPTNLKYDKETSSLVWDAMTEIGVNYNPSYELRIEKDGVSLDPVTVSQNSYKITEAGKYSVKIKSIVTDGYKTIYKDSNLTTEFYDFEVLKSATNAKIEDSTIYADKISSNKGENYVLHVYKTTQTASGFLRGDEISVTNFDTSTVENQVLWEIPQDLGAGTYEFEIVTTSGNSLIFPSIDFDAVQFEKLAIPSNIYLDSDVLFWDAVTGADGYEVFVYVDGDLNQTINSGFQENGSGFKLNLKNLGVANYTLKIRAVGNGQEKINSEQSDVATEKLADVLNFKIENDTLSWSAVANAQSYVISLNGTEKITVTSTNCDVSSWNFVSDNQLNGQSANIIEIYAQAQNSYSDKTTLEVNKLSNVTLKTKNGNVAWDGVKNAEKYEIVVYDKNKEKVFVNNEVVSNEFSFEGQTDLQQSGKYFVTVRALGNNANVRDADEIVVTNENEDDYAFTKQSIPIITGFNGDGTLSWTRGENAMTTSTFLIGVVNNGELETQIDESSTSHNLSEYLEGQSAGVLKYQFYIKAVNKQSNARYLNSEKSDYIIAYKLNAPTKLAVADGQFVWYAPSVETESMKNLIGYKLTINKTDILQENFEQRQISPTSSEMYSGTSNVKIKSYVKQNSDSSDSNKIQLNDGTVVYVLDSDYTESKQFTKLNTPTTPYISGENIVGTGVGNASKIEVVLNVNNNGKDGERKAQKTIELSNNSWTVPISSLVDESIDWGHYVVKVFALGENSYINSNVSTQGVNLYKLEAPKLQIQNGVIVWNSVSSKLNGYYKTITSYQISYKKSTDANYASMSLEDTQWNMTSHDAGEYYLKIKAISTDSAIVSSNASQEFVVTKLDAVKGDSIKILGTDSQAFDGNTITWDAVGGSASYELKITSKLDGSSETKILTTNQFTFDDSYNRSEYSITLKTTFADAVSGEETSPITIKRLSAVTGINVLGTSAVVNESSQIKSDNYQLSWDAGEGVASYKILINNEEFRTTQETSVYLINSTNGLTKDQTGNLNINIVAKISSTDLTQQNGTLTLSAPASITYQAYRNKAPSLGVENGQIIISNENYSSENNNGYTLIFVPTNTSFQTVYVNLDKSTTSYDMDNPNLTTLDQTAYKVSIIAKGSNGKVIQSERAYLKTTSTNTEINVNKLGSVNSFVVENGVVKWDIVSMADGFYVVAKSDTSKTPKSGYVSNPVGITSKVEMTSDIFSGLSGKITFTIQPKGTSGTTQANAYITSNTLTEFSVNKLEVPTGLKVQNGEICWTLNEEQDSGTNKVSGYKVVFGAQSQEVGFKNQFILSDYIGTKTSALAIKVCAIGSGSTTNGGYVTSDYTSDTGLIVQIAGQPQELGVVDGILSWSEQNGSTTYNDYELELVLENGDVQTLKSGKNSNTLIDAVNASYGYKFQSIRVRHAGTQDSKLLTSGYPSVNSKYSLKLENVVKLEPFKTVEVTEQGSLKWDHNTSAVQMMIRLNNGTYSAKTEKIIESLADSEILSSILNNNYAKFSVSYYPYVPNSRTDTSTPIYVSGETSSFNAFQFTSVSNAKIDSNRLNVSWQQDVFSIDGISNDKVIVSYQYSDNSNDVSTKSWQEKTFNVSELNKVDEFYNIPMWDLGYYNFKISVISSTASNNEIKILRSSAYEIDEQKICFNKFASGNGTADNPFVISSTENVASTESGKWEVEKTSASTKFGYIKFIPSCFFRLYEDVTLSDYDGSYLVNNFVGTDLDDVILTGGIDGQSNIVTDGNVVVRKTSKITNYRSYGGCGMFAGIVGGKNTNLTSTTADASNFFGKTGVLMNLEFEVSEYELATSGQSQNAYYASILADTMVGGMLYNCTISLSSAYAGNEISINDSGSQPITFAPFVARAYGTYVYDASEKETLSDKYSFRDTVIKNCVSNVNVSILKTSQKASISTKVAGIVGEAYGVGIYNCTNNGNLSAVRVAGIALVTNGCTTYEGTNFSQNSVSSVVGGALNTGTLNAFALSNGGNVDYSYSAGIVGESNNTFILNSINNGKINVSTIENKLGISNSATNIVYVGGVVASFSASTVGSSKFAGGLANCFNFGQISFNANDFQIDTDITSSPSHFGGVVGYVKDDISMQTCYYSLTQNKAIFALGNKYIDSQNYVGLSDDALKTGSLLITGDLKNNLIVGELNTTYFDDCSQIVQTNDAYPTIKFL